MVKTPASERIADIPPFGLRLAADLKQRVDASARANSRSINAEIAARLERTFEEDARTPLPEPSVADLEKRIAAVEQAVLSIMFSADTEKRRSAE